MVKGRRTRLVRVGTVKIGAGNPIVVQSMTRTPTARRAAVLTEIKALAAAGCEVVRLAVRDQDDVEALAHARKGSSVPLVADVHFDYRLAVAALGKGVDKIRVNPGNIGSAQRLRQVALAARKAKAAVRIGVNAGSLSRAAMKKWGGRSARAMVGSAIEAVRVFEKAGQRSLVLSLKSSRVDRTIEAYRLISAKLDYPLHLGVTEAGLEIASAIKSSLALGALLREGIGDTIRVSVTGDPLAEVRIAYGILSALGLRRRGVEVISCPVCGRCRVDLARLARRVSGAVVNFRGPLTVAVMGCEVNGPGEAREADIGVACGNGVGLIFKHGKVLKQVAQGKIVSSLLAEVRKMPGGR